MDASARHEIDQAVDRMLERLGDAIVDDAQRFAPVDTGHLRDSIHAERVGGGRIQVVAGADYAAFVELGTRHQSPQPYLRPATLRKREVS